MAEESSWTSEWRYEWIEQAPLKCAVCGSSDEVHYMKIHFGDERRIPRLVCYGCILEFHKAYEKQNMKLG